MSKLDGEVFRRALVDAERRLAPLTEACPTVQRLEDEEDGTPSYDYFAPERVVDPELQGDDYPVRRSERGMELAVETLKILAPAMQAQEAAANPYGEDADGLAWELIDDDGPNAILRQVILGACWEPEDEPGHFGDYVRGFLGAIGVLAAVGYQELDDPPPGKERPVLKVVVSRAA